MKKKFSIALSIASAIAVTPAHVLFANSADPVTIRRIPRIRWIQPHAVTSRLNA